MAGRRIRQPQRGAALLVFMILLVTAILTYVVNKLTPEEVNAKRLNKTTSSLYQAREALIGNALLYREQQRATGGTEDAMYGFLPLPDFGESINLNGNLLNQACTTEGCAKINPANASSGETLAFGRLPWKTVGLDALRDGHTECLWYAVSSTHRAINSTAAEMNWDTPPAPDILVGSGKANLDSVGAHERPLAVIFSPGPSFTSDGRPSHPDAQLCGGSYETSRYVDPSVPNTQVALPITSSMLFGAIRKHAYFRNDINSLLDRVVACLRDEIAAGSAPFHGRVAGADDNACYGAGVDPVGYYPHYRDQLFAATPGSVNVTIDGVPQSSCAGALVFSNQRGTGQQRTAPGGYFSQYLEGNNLTSFESSGTDFIGESTLNRTPPQAIEQDIVRCIPDSASFVTVASPALTSLGYEQLSSYDPATRTLKLGALGVRSSATAPYTAPAHSLFGCAWQPGINATGTGVRAYFYFQVPDRGDGFTFAMVDGDQNSASVCGAARQHLGYSGNNTYTQPVSAPKIGVEFDRTRQGLYNPSLTSANSPLFNGRNDPDYSDAANSNDNDAHSAIVYWGGELPIPGQSPCGTGCVAPRYCGADAVCYSPAEEDDNVHGYPPRAGATTGSASDPCPSGGVLPTGRAAPENACKDPYPTDPPASYPPYGMVPLSGFGSTSASNRDFHVRIELSRQRVSAVKLVATSPASLSGLPAIDGITVQSGDRLLLTAQADARQNGVYVAAAGAWSRAASEDETADFSSGMLWFVATGNRYGGSYWRLNSEAPVRIGITSLSIALHRDKIKAVATSNLASLSGLATIDGVSLAAGDRVLLTAQTAAKDNGVYLVGTGAWSRTSPEDSPAGMLAGAAWHVTAGATHAASFWRLQESVIPGSDNPINIVKAPDNDIHYSLVTLRSWIVPDSSSYVNQIATMKLLSRSMSTLDPVTRHGTCPAGSCPASDPVGQYCGGIESDGQRYCYTGHQEKLYDVKTVYDKQGAACPCGSGEYCGIDNLCYQTAFRNMRLGFTTGQGTQDQEIFITDFIDTWIP